MPKLSHLDRLGRAKMVDVSAKPITSRTATAQALIQVSPGTLRAISEGVLKKGEVFTVAKLAGIQAAKKTAELIPLCHPLMLSNIDLEFDIDHESSRIRITSQVRTEAKTGAEMEALTAAAIAALTVYDMCKAMQKDIEILHIVLLKKSGGRSGDYRRSK